MTATAELFRRQGYTGTGLKQIVTEAGAPFGSLYHFFPGGKEQLGAEVIRWSGAGYLSLVTEFFDPAPDVATAIEWAFLGAGQTLEATGYADACPIATVALEVASTNDTLRQATEDVFESWIDAVAERFAAAGITTARPLAMSVLSLLEGAFLFCRAARNLDAMHAAGATATAAVRAALAEVHTAG
ncbi:MAG TPA: TetR/AcrR family transcriptional regulator [Pseudonocardiaceae bacterium]|jgi:AcrR family transcriptional regulator|nr:TetR/AcrR family transcriptional regulator [Pseudonocardiaceae bacterium]